MAKKRKVVKIANVGLKLRNFLKYFHCYSERVKRKKGFKMNTIKKYYFHCFSQKCKNSTIIKMSEIQNVQKGCYFHHFPHQKWYNVENFKKFWFFTFFILGGIKTPSPEGVKWCQKRVKWFSWQRIVLVVMLKNCQYLQSMAGEEACKELFNFQKI